MDTVETIYITGFVLTPIMYWLDHKNLGHEVDLQKAAILGVTWFLVIPIAMMHRAHVRYQEYKNGC